jgi:hypothetical protein
MAKYNPRHRHDTPVGKWLQAVDFRNNRSWIWGRSGIPPENLTKSIRQNRLSIFMAIRKTLINANHLSIKPMRLRERLHYYFICTPVFVMVWSAMTIGFILLDIYNFFKKLKSKLC